ncbi:hypothetical protein AVU42_gp052 [Prochlorococcus phage P-TIM68]|uniref:Uncharacterized protein n=1 Tax=Prochlorococcus phage P-TIM68 TaxID=1542477 RepID=A0A0K0KVS3_9CAUD|nr:hypothetical protein AVU42_gp052 [Prochlorococcus phage P-TIM68]AIR93422.1 hypothetical protein [Prochlorococcus phage P-TIM68]
MDGAPAVVFGTHPENGKFFVGTKSVFNKKKDMICYSVEDVFNKYDRQTHDSLIRVLVNCILYLPKIDGIIQADFIGVGGSNIYRPNTLEYHFPEIVTEKIILAPHTKYTTNSTLLECVAKPLVTHLVDTKDVKWIQPSVDRVFDGAEPPKIRTDNVKFLTAKEAKEAKTAINKLIKDGVELSDYNLFEILGCNHLANLYQLLIEIKEELIDTFIVYDSPKCYVEGIQIKGEGFVMTTKYGMIKLIDRPEFAYANFNNGRFQR